MSSLTDANPSIKRCLAFKVDGWIPQEKQASEGKYLGQETGEEAVNDTFRKLMKFRNKTFEYLTYMPAKARS